VVVVHKQHVEVQIQYKLNHQLHDMEHHVQLGQLVVSLFVLLDFPKLIENEINLTEKEILKASPVSFLRI
jgi:hypothetical protein